MRHLALFDLDHTLLDGDSNTLWLAFLADRGHLPAEARSRQAGFMADYAAETLDIGDYLAFQLGLLAHRPLADWLPLRAEFLEACIAPRIGEEARAEVEGHRARGHRTAIVTATHSFLADAIGGLFGVPVLAPRAEVRDGRLTGRIDGPVCFRERKLACVARWLADEGVGTAAGGNRHFYSDSINDLPLLEAVSHPVAVNPDARLAEVAQRRGWPVRHWRRKA